LDATHAGASCGGADSDWIRERLGLSENYGLHRHERWLAKVIGASSDRIVLPPARQCNPVSASGCPRPTFMREPALRASTRNQSDVISA